MDLPITNNSDPLRMYYSSIFPFKKFGQWLAGGGSDSLSRREFSMTLANGAYLRFQSFDDSQALRERIIREVPVKLDIGAVYTSRPSERKTMGASFKPVEKELVFDIDISDYDDTRTCCKDKAICRDCWKFVTVAMRILDRSLREDFGFRHLLWVFSGRRGVHCWVSDGRARKLSPAVRKSIVGYLEVVKGGAEARKRVSLYAEGPNNDCFHPSIHRALDEIDRVLLGKDSILAHQDIVTSRSTRSRLITWINDDEVKARLRDVWLDSPSLDDPLDIWALLCKICETVNSFQSRKILAELKLQLAYPRLDTNVSIQLNHLLKAPFCIHPDTGKICIPLDFARIDQFDPNCVPTLEAILEDKNILLPYLDHFDAFVQDLELSIREERIDGKKIMLD